MTYRLFLLKRFLEDIFIWPFIQLGRAHADKYPLEESYEIFFFFPFYHTGGAEKVHAQIAQAFRGRRCLVIFTRKSHNEGFRRAFEQGGHRVLDISAYTDNKKAYWKNLVWRGVVSAHINRQKGRPLVFNGQCNFAYKCAPWFRRDIPQLELIHSYNSFSWIRVPFLPFYRQTVMISRKAISDHTAQYARLGIPGTFLTRIRLVQNGMALPDSVPTRDFSVDVIRVLYAGRATPEKRVHLVAEAAIRCRESGIPASFSFLGDIRPHLPPSLQEAGHFYGNVDDPAAVNRAYAEADVLVITSSEEGFPMVVMEAMAQGCIILATPVGDLPHHVRQGENGFIFSSAVDEKTVISEMMDFIRLLLGDAALRGRISTANTVYAREHFGLTTFNNAYRQLADQLIQQT
jgi:glycosyltransferase involved in cell wall biosynthesis